MSIPQVHLIMIQLKLSGKNKANTLRYLNKKSVLFRLKQFVEISTRFISSYKEQEL